MGAFRTSTVVATAIAALMVLSTLSGAATAHPSASAAAPTAPKAASSTPHLPPNFASLTPSGRALSVGSPARSLPRTSPNVPAPPTAPAALSGTADAAPSARTASTLATLRTDGVPLRDAFLPDLNVNPHPSLSANGTVNMSYTTGGPAPVGVAEYGITNVSGHLTPENLTTTELAGYFVSCNPIDRYSSYCTDPQVLAMDSGAPDAYGIQLNAVLENVTLFNQPGYEFWTQNVLEYSTYSHQLYIVTNIWNFSSPFATMTYNAITAHGANGTVVPGELYYSVSGPFLVSDNFTAILGMDSIVENGNDAVFFEFYVSNGSAGATWSGLNDYAVFNSTGASGPGVSTPAEYVASGSTYTPLGLPADWEFVMGGPGGGSNLDVFSLFTEMDLYYLNPSGDFSPIPSAYNVGGDTGETSIGASTVWEGDDSPADIPGPGVYVGPGPTIVEGMWNVTNSTGGASLLVNELSPSNGFTFMADTTDPLDFSAYTWAPMFWLYLLSPGDYGTWSLASNYAPQFSVVDLPNNTVTFLSVDLSFDIYAGVYTPLWALNDSGLENITWGAGVLFNNAYGPLGALPFGIDFPFFAAMNDYAYPVFAGILLWYTSEAIISNPPTFTVNYPSSYDRFLDYYGLPTSNQLPILVYDSEYVVLTGATAISGWWFTLAEYGPTTPAYNVVFWNTSYSEIFNNHFLTSSNALYLYGGTDNEIFNNTFVQAFPAAPDLFAISGYYYGTYALLEADYGDYAYDGEICGCWDLIYNNLFDTYFTAYNPVFDPYTGGYPVLPFSELWNYPHILGTNIIGGAYLGGNYWWNYGSSDNPYGDLPYVNFQPFYEFLWGISPWGINWWPGDALPLTPTPVYTVTFEEVGLPAGTFWTPEVETFDGGWVYNYTTLPYANESWIAGTYNLSAYSETNYSYVGATNFTVLGNETVVLDFAPDYTVSFEETGLPAGTDWYVETYSYDTGDLAFNESSGTWVNLTLAPGYYAYEAVPYSSPYLSPQEYGYFTIDAANLTIEIHFFPAYAVTFDETGLPADQSWTIIWEITGPDGSNNSYTLNQSSADLGYGLGGWTIAWWVLAPGYVATPASGSFVLSENTTVSVTFAAAATITFDESGLAAGAAWTVSLTQGTSTTTESSTGTSLVFAAEAGAYSYTVTGTGYTATPASGSGTLPADDVVDVTFVSTQATVTFSETGLPAGTLWTVEFTQDAVTTNYSGIGAAIAISAEDGAYSYSVKAANFSASTPSGSGTLPADSAVSEVFTVVDGTLSGSISPSTTFTVNPGTGATTVTPGAGGAFDTNLAPGTYAVKVVLAGYYPYYTNVTIVSGHTTHLAIVLTAVPSTPKPFLGVSSSTDWILIAALAVLALILLGTTLLFLGRSRRPPQMTQYTGTAPPAGAAGSAAGQPAWSESDSGTPPPGKN